MERINRPHSFASELPDEKCSQCGLALATVLRDWLNGYSPQCAAGGLGPTRDKAGVFVPRVEPVLPPPVEKPVVRGVGVPRPVVVGAPDVAPQLDKFALAAELAAVVSPPAEPPQPAFEPEGVKPDEAPPLDKFALAAELAAQPRPPFEGEPEVPDLDMSPPEPSEELEQ